MNERKQENLNALRRRRRRRQLKPIHTSNYSTTTTTMIRIGVRAIWIFRHIIISFDIYLFFVFFYFWQHTMHWLSSWMKEYKESVREEGRRLENNQKQRSYALKRQNIESEEQQLFLSLTLSFYISFTSWNLIFDYLLFKSNIHLLFAFYINTRSVVCFSHFN